MVDVAERQYLVKLGVRNRLADDLECCPQLISCDVPIVVAIEHSGTSKCDRKQGRTVYFEGLCIIFVVGYTVKFSTF